MHKLTGLALAAALLVAPAANAVARNAISQDEMVAALAAVGATGIERANDAAGDPTVFATLHDALFQVLMYDCNGAGCTSIQFRSGYDLDEGMTLEALNEWNTAMRYGNTWLDEVDDPYLELDLDLSGGSSDGQVAAYVATWSSMMEAFHDYVGY